MDHLSNSDSKIIETGENESYNTINFLNYIDHIKKNGKLYVDNEEVTSPIYGTLKKDVRVKIVFNQKINI